MQGGETVEVFGVEMVKGLGSMVFGNMGPALTIGVAENLLKALAINRRPLTAKHTRMGPLV